MRVCLHDALDVPKRFTNTYINVDTTSLGKWRRSTGLGKAQDAGLASDTCKPASDSARFFRPGGVPRPRYFVLPSFWERGASQKPRQTWCSLWLVMFGWRFLKERARENKNLIFIGHRNENNSSLNRAVAFHSILLRSLWEKQAMCIVSEEQRVVLHLYVRK